MKTTKAKRLIKIINLIYSRKFITRQEISRRFGTSKRTTFRDINDISELNIPIYYDDELKQYRLNTANSGRVKEWNLNEIILIIIGLSHLAERVNRANRLSIKNLINKLLIWQPIEVENILNVKEDKGSTFQNISRHDELINLSMVNMAISLKKSITIKTLEERGGNHIKIDRPSIVFKTKWQVFDGDNQTSRYYDISDIVKVRIIE